MRGCPPRGRWHQPLGSPRVCRNSLRGRPGFLSHCLRHAGVAPPPVVTKNMTASALAPSSLSKALACGPAPLRWQGNEGGGWVGPCGRVKVDEDFGPLVKDKRNGASDGQQKRLDYLQSVLGLKTLDDGIRYQLLHRTASAILTARDFHAGAAVMMVQSFGKKAALREDFEAFCQVLKAEKLFS